MRSSLLRVSFVPAALSSLAHGTNLLTTLYRKVHCEFVCQINSKYKNCTVTPLSLELIFLAFSILRFDILLKVLAQPICFCFFISANAENCKGFKSNPLLSSHLSDLSSFKFFAHFKVSRNIGLRVQQFARRGG